MINMIEVLQAQDIAMGVLAEYANEPGVPQLAIMQVDEVALGWIFYYQSLSYIESGSYSDMAVGTAPIVVERETAAVHSLGTARSTSFYLAEFEAGNHTCELCGKELLF